MSQTSISDPTMKANISHSAATAETIAGDLESQGVGRPSMPNASTPVTPATPITDGSTALGTRSSDYPAAQQEPRQRDHDRIQVGHAERQGPMRTRRSSPPGLDRIG